MVHQEESIIRESHLPQALFKIEAAKVYGNGIRAQFGKPVFERLLQRIEMFGIFFLRRMRYVFFLQMREKPGQSLGRVEMSMQRLS